MILWFTNFSLGHGLKSTATNVARSYKLFKNIHDGPGGGGIFNLSLFHTEKNELEFSPN